MGLGTASNQWLKNLPDQLPPVIYACGPEFSLKQEMLERLQQEYPNSKREIISIYADEYSPSQFVQLIQTQGLFNPSRWIILKQLQVEEGGQPQLARYFDTLTDYVKDPEPDTVLFLFDSDHPYQSGRKTGGMVRAVENAGGAALVFWEPFHNQIYQRIQKTLDEQDLQYDAEAIEEIIHRCEGKWSRIKQELQKLQDWFSAGDSIGSDEVKRVVSDEESKDAYQPLKQAMTAGEYSRLFDKLEEFYRQSASGSEHRVTHILVHYLNDLRDIRAMCREGKSLEQALKEKEIPRSKKITGQYKKSLRQTNQEYPKDFFRRSYQVLKNTKYREKPFNRYSLEKYLLKMMPEVSSGTR